MNLAAERENRAPRSAEAMPLRTIVCVLRSATRTIGPSAENVSAVAWDVAPGRPGRASTFDRKRRPKAAGRRDISRVFLLNHGQKGTY